jgi:hypothetical protein
MPKHPVEDTFIFKCFVLRYNVKRLKSEILDLFKPLYRWLVA